MPSPFPGMDPYLEARWGDLHTRLATYCTDQLQPRLPSDLRARIEEHVVKLRADGQRGERWKPDARIVELPRGDKGRTANSGGVLVSEPTIVTYEADPLIERGVRIFDTSDGSRLITAIEFLSPSNKSSPSGRRSYRRKQRSLMSGANLVEVDLIRTGGYVLMPPKDMVPAELLAPYRICVSRCWAGSESEMYRVPLSAALPKIAIPLREADPDVVLDLQALLDLAYENGRYSDTDYSIDADPPLTGEDAEWADQLLREKGLR